MTDERSDEERHMNGGDRRPVPDPSTLTTEQLEKGLANLKELLETRVEAQSLIATEKFRAFEQWLERANERVEEIRSHYDAVLIDRDARYTERHEASDMAVNAAFAASEKAILKAEVSIEKRADATYVALGELQRLLTALMPRSEAETRYATQERDIRDVQSRLDRIEAKSIGAKEDRTGLYATIGAVGGVLLLAMTIVGFLAARGGP